MKKIYATIVKEWILLRRDVAGATLLLLMPSVLIVVMALIQDSLFRDYQERRFDLLLADNDGGSLSVSIREGLRQSRHFRLVDSIDGSPVTEAQLQTLLQQGVYRVGVVIPRGATAEVANAANLVANSVSARLGMGTLPVRAPRDSVYVRIFFDPVAKPTFRMSVSFALEKYINYSGTQVLMERLSRMAGVSADSSQATLAATFRGLGIREEQLSSRGVDTALVNSVQHNVPAWAIFGMFFIVVPIAGHMIREREEGSALRLALIPSSVPFVSLGKVCFYVLVCMTQFFLMLAIGICLLPMLGLPRLSLGAHPWALLPVAACISFNATAYGYFIGSVFRTPNQALPFGAISVVILSALGGIWIPTDILPPLVQRIALISPLYWALDSVNQLFLRNLGLAEVTRHMLILTGAGAALWLFAYLRNSRRAAGIQ